MPWGAMLGWAIGSEFSQRILNMNVVYIYLIILGASGLLMDWGLTLLRRKLCPWFGE